MRLHLNWGACSDWSAARARLQFLKTTLFANFADIQSKQHKRIEAQLKARGFNVTVEPCITGGLLLRLSDMTGG
jgi:hypothetical protein